MPEDHLFIAYRQGRRVIERWVTGPKAARLKVIYECAGYTVEVRDPAAVEAFAAQGGTQ